MPRFWKESKRKGATKNEFIRMNKKKTHTFHLHIEKNKRDYKTICNGTYIIMSGWSWEYQERRIDHLSYWVSIIWGKIHIWYFLYVVFLYIYCLLCMILLFVQMIYWQMCYINIWFNYCIVYWITLKRTVTVLFEFLIILETLSIL